MLHRKYMRKVPLPHMNFTNTQLKTTNTQEVNFPGLILNSTQKVYLSLCKYMQIISNVG